ncbi:MAG: hypothetical protein ACREP8_12250 [Candidatus Binatia bacterium]
MDLQKVNVKFFLENQDAVPLADCISIFNSWIQTSEGAYYDIADYSHVAAGPGLVLVAHEANVSVDNTGNRWGLLYSRKQPLSGSNRDKLRWVFKAALENCRRIEEEPLLKGRISFVGNEALFLINDRLLAPNTEETFDAVRTDLEGLGGTLYAGADFHLEPGTKDARERFGVRITTPLSFDIVTLLRNLGDNDVEVGKRATT